MMNKPIIQNMFIHPLQSKKLYLTPPSDNYIISQLKSRIQSINSDSFLLKENVIDWCFYASDFVKNLTPEMERKWGNSLLALNTNQWTTRVGETIVKETLELLGENPRRIMNRKKDTNGKMIIPDWETDMALYECKTRTYTVCGTAGEKVLSSPDKYRNCYELYKKELYIVCIANQEKEAEQDFLLFGNRMDKSRQKINKFYKDEFKIETIPLTQLLMKLLEK